jgi:hypothetical protein
MARGNRASGGARALFRGLPQRVCAGCGGPFVPARPNQTSCRPSCRALASRRGRVREWVRLRGQLDRLFGVEDDDPDDAA